jgi:hypothetical protein
MAKKEKVTEQIHPDYRAMSTSWKKFRLTYDGGREFVETYLRKFSIRENTGDFAIRKEISYCPAHAKAAIIDIKNAIYQRLVEIQRLGGPNSYVQAVNGQNGGVTRTGMTMTTFIGTQPLAELLTMAKVGVFVDKDKIDGKTKRDVVGITPYLYFYTAEEILSWSYDREVLQAVLLQERQNEVDPVTKLVTGSTKIYRHLSLTEKGVQLSVYDANGKRTSTDIINLTRIPFVIGQISQSLLTDVADYQIALLNLESSDIGYSLKSNFPFYVEQFNPQMENIAKLMTSEEDARENVAASGEEDAKIGATHGRKYAKGLERPSFIHPSSEPLRASMEKASQIKEDIRKLVNLSLKNLERPSGSQSADLTDEKGLEAGLSYIGMELERIEREIAEIWAAYENAAPAVVKYPKKYSLRSDEERMGECERLNKLKTNIPSKTCQKEIDKLVTTTLLETKLSYQVLETIHKEIDTAIVTVTDHETIREDHKSGLVSDKTASKILGYPEGESEQAKKDHADRAARIALAQSKIADRGVSELQNPGDNDLDKVNKDRRGETNAEN